MNVIFCVPFTGVTPSADVWVNVAEFTSAKVSLVVTPVLLCINVSVAPLALVATNCSPVKSILSPCVYSVCAIGDVIANDVTGSVTVVLNVAVFPS